MVYLERGTPDKLRNTVLIYSDFEDFGKLPSCMGDSFKDVFKSKIVGLFAALNPEAFVPGVEMMTRNATAVEGAKRMLENSKFDVHKNPSMKRVLGIVLPFREMYKTTVEGDVICTGTTTSFVDSINAVNRDMNVFARAYAHQNGGDLNPPRETDLNLNFMKGYADLPEDGRATHIMRTYVQPMMQYLEHGDCQSATGIARGLENFCYESCLSPEAEKVCSLLSNNQFPKVQDHLELLLAVADQRYLDAARIRDSIKKKNESGNGGT